MPVEGDVDMVKYNYSKKKPTLVVSVNPLVIYKSLL
jgi:hypothetical protein